MLRALSCADSRLLAEQATLAVNSPFNPTAANVAAVAAKSVWPNAAAYGLTNYPPQRDFTQAANYCYAIGKLPATGCPASSLGSGDPRWVAGNNAFINVFGITKYDCKYVARPRRRVRGL